MAAMTSLASAQMGSADWKKFDKLMQAHSYASAYAYAEKVYGETTDGSIRLAAAYHMALAASRYQEDAGMKNEERYRALLPSLEGLEKALCHAFLGEYDLALAEENVLKATPVKRIAMYCIGGETLNVTPTAYDVVALAAQESWWDDPKRAADLQLGPAESVSNTGWDDPKRAADLQRKLVDQHAGDDDVQLWHLLRWIELRQRIPNHKVEDSEIKALVGFWKGSKSGYVSSLHLMMANRCNDAGRYVEALEWCERGIAHAAKSEGGVGCANLKGEILQVRVDIDDRGKMIIPGRPSLQRVRYRNADHLWLRVVKVPEKNARFWGEKRELLAAARVVDTDVEVVANSEYKYEEILVALPALSAGRYALLVSPTKDFSDGFDVCELHSTEMHFVYGNGQVLLLDRRTGLPIEGQQIELHTEDVVVAKAVTDADGRYRFGKAYETWRSELVIERNGYRLNTRYYSGYEKEEYKEHVHCEMRTDRPIYRPGERLQAAILVYRSDGREAKAAGDMVVHVKLEDPNGKVVAEDTMLRCNEYGIASTAFDLPQEGLAGNYRLQVLDKQSDHIGFHRVRVEAYKQPTFMVTMETVGIDAPAFGKEIVMRGLAMGYNGVPTGNAKVRYSVKRQKLSRWWWSMSREVGQEVASGEAETTADGTFEVRFVPEPDSNVELSAKPVFEYEVEVDVTDLGGESHPAVERLRVGYRNAFLSLDEASTPSDLKVRHFDINGNELPIDGVGVKVELLRQPERLLLESPLLADGVHQTLTEENFRVQFPLLAYSKAYNDPSTWEGREVKDRKTSGMYRITLTAEDADTVTEYRTVVAAGARRVEGTGLLWAEVDKQKAEVGETVSLRFGSRFDGVQVHYLLRVGKEERDYRRVAVSDALKEIVIPVDATMLGGFDISLLTVKEGVESRWTQHIAVPYSHKQLNIEIATFRDKLLPGAQEQWTLKVSGRKGGEKAALVLAMYDDALNSYGSADSWGFSPWRSQHASTIPTWSPYSHGRNLMPEHRLLDFKGEEPSVWRFKTPWVYYATSRRRLSLSKAAWNDADVVPAVMECYAVSDAEEESIETVDMAKGGEIQQEPKEVQIRSDLSTLAFFAPCVETDGKGTTVYRFTVPELLTRWNVRGLAVTRDIKIGTLDKMLTTSKPLMVQPNMPRFLRSGDSLQILAKVVSEEGRTYKGIKVLFELTDAATGKIIGREQKRVDVVGTSQVSFGVDVPQDVHVVTYRIVAEGDGASDGEQGQIAVVGNREAVTVSRALYINGSGEKRYKMEEWMEVSGTRKPERVGAEVVSDPMWLAVKTLPHLKELESPSTVYLANRFYTEMLGAQIAGNYISDEAMEALAEGGESRLQMNEDVKQTLLQHCPWVAEAKSEADQMAAVVRFLDRDRTSRELSQLREKLVQAQQSDGGWSWMPEGQSSVWTTQRVLRRIASDKEMRQRVAEMALAYVDREQQKHYEHYVKPYLKKGYRWQPTDIDYLYTRSLYGAAETEAYKCYYSNALKNYRDYENLYTQAQLALIFGRHGDRKAALDLLRRIKEKSLESDEMGIYWRDNTSGWYWYERPIETQAMLIKAFAELTPQDGATIGKMQQWLLKQKQTTHWGNDLATVEAVAALMAGRPEHGLRAAGSDDVQLTVFGEELAGEVKGAEGYRSARWTGDALGRLRGHRTEEITLHKQSQGMAWGAVYYQFTDDMDKLPHSETGITVKRSYQAAQPLGVGDRIKVRIDFHFDRAMDYLEIVDGRPSCVEPLSTKAGWRWNDGLSYYIVVDNTATKCYVEHVDKGDYYLEYEVYVTNPGSFLSGPVKVQSMYAPEFRSVAPGVRLEVRQ